VWEIEISEENKFRRNNVGSAYETELFQVHKLKGEITLSEVRSKTKSWVREKKFKVRDLSNIEKNILSQEKVEALEDE